VLLFLQGIKNNFYFMSFERGGYRPPEPTPPSRPDSIMPIAERLRQAQAKAQEQERAAAAAQRPVRESVKEYVPINERLRQTKEKANLEASQGANIKPRTMEQVMADRKAERAAELAQSVASEKTKILTELSLYNHKDKVSLLKKMDTNLSREEKDSEDSPYDSGEAAENLLKARRGAIEALKKDWGIGEN